MGGLSLRVGQELEPIDSIVLALGLAPMIFDKRFEVYRQGFQDGWVASELHYRLALCLSSLFFNVASDFSPVDL